jgi:transposase
MPRMSKVELFAAIRKDSRAGMSGRAIATKYRVSRHTVSDALASAWPRERKPLPPRPSVLDPFKTAIDDILRVDLDAPRKQRHTAKRIYDRLIDEHGMEASPTRWSAVTSPNASRRSGPRPAGDRSTCSSRRHTSPARPGAEALCGKPHKASFLCSVREYAAMSLVPAHDLRCVEPRTPPNTQRPSTAASADGVARSQGDGSEAARELFSPAQRSPTTQSDICSPGGVRTW